MNLLEPIKDFGSIDAENDNRLIEYFYRTEIIDSLLNYDKSIVIGRKGSGKTAIYKYLVSEKSDETSSLLFRDYPWKVHDSFKNNQVSDRESFINSWSFLFYIEIFKNIVKQKKKITNKPIKKTVLKIEKWIKKNWGEINFDHKETLTPKKNFSFVFAPTVMGNSLGSVSKEFQKAENLGSTLSEFNRKFADIIKKVIPNLPFEIFLLFDELDLSYTAKDELYKDRLIGLLLTSYNFYSNYKSIKIFAFLRNDIFNILDFQDKNKIKDNMIIFLDWDSENIPATLSLKELISNRIKVNINGSSDNFERNWNEVMDINNIGRNQKKWNFIIERSFNRPRDIIKFLNLSLEQAKKRLRNDPQSIDKITNEDMHNIRSNFSTYLLEELKDEVTSKYEDFDDYLEILRDIHYVYFTLEQYILSYNNVKMRKNMNVDIDTALERLYEFGIIGFYKTGGGGYGGSEYRFQFSSDYQAFNNKANKYKVHYGFKEYLDLNEKL